MVAIMPTIRDLLLWWNRSSKNMVPSKIIILVNQR
jgi:hypothetical protein